MSVHLLKLWPTYFEPLRRGAKTFEIRSEVDRRFEVDDFLILGESDPEKLRSTGVASVDPLRTLSARVSYVLRDAEHFGLKPGFAILGLQVERRRLSFSALVPYTDEEFEADFGSPVALGPEADLVVVAAESAEAAFAKMLAADFAEDYDLGAFSVADLQTWKVERGVVKVDPTDEVEPGELAYRVVRGSWWEDAREVFTLWAGASASLQVPTGGADNGS